MKIAIVGIQGIPNNYGGFETLTEYLVKYLSRDFEITVYCSSKDIKTKQTTWNGAKLEYIPISSHGAQGIIYDSIALCRACFSNDKILFLGFGGGFVIPLLKKFKPKIILNFGGLDWKRDKWSASAQRMIKIAERNLVKNSSVVIADNIGIQQYIKQEYQIDAPLIAYGGDQAKHLPVTDGMKERYPFLNSRYAFSVARIQPDNNIEMMLEAFSRFPGFPFVIVGNWNVSAFGRSLRNKYAGQKNLFLLDAIYDREILDVLRSNCAVYLHGHSAGGTNPSLCEAMYLGLPVIAYASGYNEYTTQNDAIYFKDKDTLAAIIDQIDSFNLKMIGEKLEKTAREYYRWSEIALKYKRIILK
ncbi:DUF1972 domain-containing protein [Parabacteroides sp. Marseille-P3160]|uniref:DUF1972 domain-containing protein n=1 Tax=Parabacteroides sp. Marseille-P3160 TaxID=1917887 RepID=UPI0009B98AFD|nr:DUF1972 domain-containing protein [Parabacteroides sp. Marseille-P3160]